MASLVLIVVIKQYRPEFALYISLISGVLILLLALSKITGIISLLKVIGDRAGINNQYLAILLKMTGIAFLSEFAVSICNDSGESAIASKIELGTKAIIISMSIPIIYALLEIILKLLPNY